jgi:hypothetical protein
MTYQNPKTQPLRLGLSWGMSPWVVIKIRYSCLSDKYYTDALGDFGCLCGECWGILGGDGAMVLYGKP